MSNWQQQINVLESRGIMFSRFRYEDAPAVIDFFNDPKVIAHTVDVPSPYTALDAKHFITHMIAHSGTGSAATVFALRDDADRLVGYIGFESIDQDLRCGRLGYWLAPKLWDQGLMTLAIAAMVAYAQEILQLKRIIAEVFPEHVPSIRVLEKNDFKHFEEIHVADRDACLYEWQAEP